MADKRRIRKKATGMDKLPKGTIFIDAAKLQWEILEPIGEGGFGIIYGTRKVNEFSKNEYAIKVEPHGNGPLFVERNYFLRYLKPELLEDYKRKHKLSFLGLPKYISGGTHNVNNISHRFLVMERFGDNINSKLKIAKTINLELLGKYCSQIIDSLMYIHDTGYVHMDIKPENLLLKFNAKDDQVYLIDFGVIDKCNTYPELKPDKKKQHNGTLLYSSRDSHLGIGTRRGDLEVLGYNIVKWFDVDLPWTEDIKTPAIVQEKKIAFMEKLPAQVLKKVPEHIIEYLKYVNSLKPNEIPDYLYVKALLSNERSSTKLKSPSKRKSDEPVSLSPSKKSTARNQSLGIIKNKNANSKSKPTRTKTRDENGSQNPVSKVRRTRKVIN